ncbi:MAG: hypothetical protein Q8M23_06670, partial [Bacteroidales bacterium]|nr:hypothetical protein [Bacteroidales bacterium]
MLRLGWVLLLMCSIAFDAISQIDPEVFSETVLLRREHAGGIFAHSQGAGIEFRKGYNRDFLTKWLYEIDLLGMKSEREFRSSNPISRNARSYVYGKQNNIYILRGGGGQQKLLNRKPYWGGVEVRYFWFAGGSL